MQRLPSGAGLEVFDTLDSTSAEAKRRSASGERGPLWIVAHEQTAGVGRRGREWVTGRGNFAGTYLFEPAGNLADFGQLSFVVALSVIEALDRYVAPGALALKWPNDILAGTGKLAGILLETMTNDQRLSVCAGIGVNLSFAPPGLAYEAARLKDHLKPAANLPLPQELAAQIDEQFAANYAIWLRDGFSSVRTAWLARAKGVDEPVRVTLPSEAFTGVFRDLDQTGALIVSVNGAERRITAGEIMFGE